MISEATQVSRTKGKIAGCKNLKRLNVFKMVKYIMRKALWAIQKN